MEKIDIHHTDRQYAGARDKLSRDERIVSINRRLILRFLDDSAIGKTARRRARVKSVGIRARLKNLYLLKTVAIYFGPKHLKQLTVKDVERLVHALDRNTLKDANDTNYAEQTKANMKSTLIIFLRWMLGENSKRFHDMTYWIDTRFKAKDIPALEEQDVLRILAKCTTLKQRVLVSCLFDGGFRIEEFLNIRSSDVRLVEGTAPYFRLRVRHEFSKTKGRTVSMLWRSNHEIISAWMESKEGQVDPEAPFFPGTYDGVRQILKKLGDRTGMKLHAHLFRHGSATYYANKSYNEFQLNKRYGWSQGSDMGRRYVDESKLDEVRQVKEYEDTAVGELRSRLLRQEQESRIRGDALAQVSSRQAAVAKKLDMLLAVLKDNPDVVDTLAMREARRLRAVFDEEE